ncbi:hypothetical protein STEG23_034280, partial [Scotinomys teguina]
MIEVFKEKMKNFLKEIKEKSNKKLEDISKSLKESHEKAIKQMRETVQDLKTEIETIKKTQTEGMLDVKNLIKRTGTTDTSIYNRMQEMEERISGIEGIEEIDPLVKENTKANKIITRNIQEISDTMKRPNLRIIGIQEGEEYQLKGIENIFNKIIEENFLNLKKEILMKGTVQGVGSHLPPLLFATVITPYDLKHELPGLLKVPPPAPVGRADYRQNSSAHLKPYCKELYNLQTSEVSKDEKIGGKVMKSSNFEINCTCYREFK